MAINSVLHGKKNSTKRNTLQFIASLIDFTVPHAELRRGHRTLWKLGDGGDHDLTAESCSSMREGVAQQINVPHAELRRGHRTLWKLGDEDEPDLTSES